MSEPTAEQLLREVRRILKTPEGESVVMHARKVMDLVETGRVCAATYEAERKLAGFRGPDPATIEDGVDSFSRHLQGTLKP